MRRIFISELPNIDRSQFIEYSTKEIKLSYHERKKTRQKICVDDLELVLTLGRGSVIKPYSYIYIDSENRMLYKVVPAEEEILRIKINDVKLALLVGHILGNMHFPVGVEQDEIITLYDPSVEHKLVEAGFKVSKSSGYFIEISEGDANEHKHG